MYSLLAEYLATAHGDLDEFLVRCSDPYAQLHVALSFSTGFKLSSLELQPGFTRLNPLTQEKVEFFSAHWTFLWQCACAALQQTTKADNP